MTKTPFLKTQSIQISGMDCGNCAKTIEISLKKISGITKASVSFATGQVKVSYDPQQVSEAEIKNRLTALGYIIEQTASKTLQVQVSGMDCGSCAKTVETGVQQIPGVFEVGLSFATGRLKVSYDPQLVSEVVIYDCVARLGYTVESNPTAIPANANSSSSREQNPNSNSSSKPSTSQPIRPLARIRKPRKVHS